MGAYKKTVGRKVYIDFTDIKCPSWKIREVQKLAHQKHRILKQLDPFAKGTGRKRAYEDPEELRLHTAAYFKAQECFIYDRWGQPIRDSESGKKVVSTKPLTISGLALHLGISTRTLKRYAVISEAGLIPPEFADVVLEALQRVEEYAETRGYDKDGALGSKHVLKAGFGWTEPIEESSIAKTKNDIQIQKALLKIKQAESETKLRLLNMDDDEDSEITITVKRKGED